MTKKKVHDDFNFGKNRSGNIELLKELGAQENIEIIENINITILIPVISRFNNPQIYGSKNGL